MWGLHENAANLNAALPRLAETLSRAVAALKSLQKPDGHWCGELEGDSILESEYLLMKFILGQEREPMASGADGWTTLNKIARCLREQQREDGGWGQYPGSGVDVSATVKAYFALKLMGDSPDADHMVRARECVLKHGGAEKCNSFTNFYLACLGQISWNAVPAIPPELIFLPRWFYFHMTKVSAWTRTMILPLSLVVTLRPTRTLPRELGIDELYIDNRERHRLSAKPGVPTFWRAFFHTVDRTLKMLHKLGGTPIRRVAINAAREWMLKRAGQDGIATTAGLGAIFPPMVYLQIALHAMGWKRSHPVLQRAERELDEFFIEDETDGTIRIQPCFSPVWDTGIALYALTDCGLGLSDASIAGAARWLLAKECKHVGDWIANVSPKTAPAGWYFEYHNAWYPDVDDTAMVAMALKRAAQSVSTDALVISAVDQLFPPYKGGGQGVGAPSSRERTNGTSSDLAHLAGSRPGKSLLDAAQRVQRAASRGVAWILAMQNSDGGWAAFDKTKHRQILEYIPFADHNAMQDPSCPDITGRVLECLSWHGYTVNDEPVRRAIEYIKSHQHAEGCWFGRWGVNYIYGTWQSVIGPIRCGASRDEEWIQRAGRWIKSIQQADGSFGESANSYEDPSLKGQGPSTASQTAWAAMILQEVFGPNDPDLLRALTWLADTQLSASDANDPALNPDGDPAGSWCETWFTGTGFPKVFYLRYHLYRLYFPVMALGRFLRAHNIEWRGSAAFIEPRPEPARIGVN